MQACNRCHAVYINETVKYHFLYFSRSLLFSTISHSSRYPGIIKKLRKKKKKKNRLGQVKTRYTCIY